MLCRILLLGSSALLLPGCIYVKMAPVEVRATVDVNVKTSLDDFFGELDKKSSTINTPDAK